MMGVKSVWNNAGNGDFGSGLPVPVAAFVAVGAGLGKRPLFSRFSGLCGICALLCLASFFPFPSANAQEIDAGDLDNLDHLMSSYQSQGLKINRLGNHPNVVGDWSTFQDFLRAPDGVPGYSFGDPQTPQTSGQAAWPGRNGFSIVLEGPGGESQLAAASERIGSLQGLSEGSPNLILSWQGEFADQGRYKVSALGRKLDLKGVHEGVVVDDEELGWGVQLAGGWRFGDLFAALRVTLGNGIDSLILKRFGSDVAVSPSGDAETLESFTILPSLNYSIDKRSDLHFSVGRYQSRDGEAGAGIDTLDTINLGYTWSPWPSARIGVEVVGKDFEGTLSDEDSTEIKIGAEKRF